MLFLDINMPLKNGFECLREIKAGGSFRGMKIIMFSTSSSTIHIEISYKLGADFYAVKPGSFQHLKEMLAKILDIDWDATQRNKKNFLLASRTMNAL
ncbi:response regulator [Flavobacterium sp. SORGH_AS_0622]|uniref:response regulator n=1 Tax=Flavobacterium sp. SORGH_AS_0622 TaxID=3041772 RepID=UPI0027D8E0A2|nr:response regulator [Flavobacterium sp. SORGH_AS_0622]